MFLIVVYIAFRFDWRYAVPMIVALIHDLMITVGVYSLSDREVSSATVAAVLTVLGYSLYDTIIIFDRVRENEAHLRKHTYDEIVNISLWETLTRSLNTSFITLLPILSLFIFGGETLQDFAFALLIGIASGAYSSFFIAAPLLALHQGPPARVQAPHGLQRAAVVPAAATPAPAPAAEPVAAGRGAATASKAAVALRRWSEAERPPPPRPRTRRRAPQQPAAPVDDAEARGPRGRPRAPRRPQVAPPPARPPASSTPAQGARPGAVRPAP